MVTNFLKTRKYRQQLDEYETWARGMGAAAAATRTPLQWCMAMPSDVLLSASLDWVTNGRASDDYALATNLPQFAGGALLMWAFGVRPSKDNFWTTNGADPLPRSAHHRTVVTSSLFRGDRFVPLDDVVPPLRHGPELPVALPVGRRRRDARQPGAQPRAQRHRRRDLDGAGERRTAHATQTRAIARGRSVGSIERRHTSLSLSLLSLFSGEERDDRTAVVGTLRGVAATRCLRVALEVAPRVVGGRRAV